MIPIFRSWLFLWVFISPSPYSICLPSFKTFLSSLFSGNENDVHREYFDQLDIDSPFPEGEWGKVDMCPEGQFVSGFSVEYQPYQGTSTSVGRIFAGIFSFGIYNVVSDLNRGLDDNGLTGVFLYCKSKPSDTEYKIISSLSNGNGNHRQERLDVKTTRQQFCTKTFAAGLTVYMQEAQTGTVDDAGITNLRLHCEDGQKLRTTLDYDPGKPLPGPPTSCPSGTAICGLQTKVEFGHIGDNTGLNDLKIFCCKLPKPTDESETCDPQEAWKTVTSFANEGETPTTHQFQIRVGLTNSNENRQIKKHSTSSHSEYGSGQSVGGEYGASQFQKVVLSARFEQKFGSLSTDANENEKKSEESLETEHLITQTVEVGPKKIISVRQKIRSCGPFRINTIDTRRIDECIKGYQETCDAFDAANKFGGSG